MVVALPLSASAAALRIEICFYLPSAIPAEIAEGLSDTRRLSIALAAITFSPPADGG